MKPIFTYADRYTIIAKCTAPFCTGGAEQGSLLRGAGGEYMVQASSIAGVMRNWLFLQGEEEMAAELFGSQKGMGSLAVSNGIFLPGADAEVRPRIRMNPRLGIADGVAKFETAYLPSGSQFCFTIIWTGNTRETKERGWIEQMLTAIHRGEITLGGQSSNGFGRLQLSVLRKEYDMRQAGDREQWIAGAAGGEELNLEVLDNNRFVTFCLEGKAKRILCKSATVSRVSSGNGLSRQSVSFQGNMLENNIPVIPGSAVKGMVSGRIRAIADYLSVPEQIICRAFGTAPSHGKEGSAGTCRFSDVALDRKSQVVSRIRIDKFTGGVFDGGLFSQRPHTSGICLQIRVPADQQALCALMLYALRDLGMGLYNLGSGYSVGYGMIQGKTLTASWGKRRTELTFDSQGKPILSDTDGLAAEWQDALRSVCHEN